MSDAPLNLYKDVVRPHWIDYNGHLNDGYYAVAFGIATERFLEHINLHTDYLEKTGCTIYTAEAHISYLRELKEAAPLNVTCRVLGVDAKRIQIYQEMFHAEEGYLASSYEAMFLHVDQRILKTVPMPERVQAHLQEILKSHETLEPPILAGRSISLIQGA